MHLGDVNDDSEREFFHVIERLYERLGPTSYIDSVMDHH